MRFIAARAGIARICLGVSRGRLLIQRQRQIAVFVQARWVGCEPTVAEQGRAAGKIELPGVERADQRAAADQPIGQRAAAVRTARLRGVDRATARVEHRDPQPADIKYTPFADRDLRERAEDTFCGRCCHWVPYLTRATR